MSEPHHPASRPRPDASTPLALAAGLAIGHVVAAMAESGIDRTLAGPSAVVFVLASCAAVVCALQAARSRGPRPAAAAPLRRWVAALGAGLLSALAPGLF